MRSIFSPVGALAWALTLSLCLGASPQQQDPTGPPHGERTEYQQYLEALSSFERTQMDEVHIDLVVRGSEVRSTIDGEVVATANATENALKVAYLYARDHDLHGIGLRGKVQHLFFGDGKPDNYNYSVNGCSDISLIGLSPDATVGRLFFSSNNCDRLRFYNLRIDASMQQSAVHAAMGQGPWYGMEFESCTLVTGPGTKWGWRLHGNMQHSVRGCTVERAAGNTSRYTLQEQLLYADNPPGDSEVVYCEADDLGRALCQYVNRIESGPPGKGWIVVAHNVTRGNLDAYGITIAGHSDLDSGVIVAHNQVALGDQSLVYPQYPGAGGVTVWREGANLPKGKLGAWPLGSEGDEGYGPGFLPPASSKGVNYALLVGNEITGSNCTKDAVSVSSADYFWLGPRNVLSIDNRTALLLGYTGPSNTIELAIDSSSATWQSAQKVKLVGDGPPKVLSGAEIDALVVPAPTQPIPFKHQTTTPAAPGS